MKSHCVYKFISLNLLISSSWYVFHDYNVNLRLNRIHFCKIIMVSEIQIVGTPIKCMRDDSEQHHWNCSINYRVNYCQEKNRFFTH